MYKRSGGFMLRTLIKIYFILILVFLWSFTKVNAAEFFEYAQSIRQYGMGGVYAFNDDDAGSYLQNPAYSCYLKGFNWTVLDLNAGINGLQVYNDFQGSNINGIGSLTPFFGKKVWLGLGAQTTFTLPCFGVSIYDSGFLTFLLHNPANPNLDMTYLNDYAFSIGGAIPITPVLSLGLAVKRTTRSGGTALIGTSLLTTASSSTLLDQFSKRGDGYGFDMGLVGRFTALPLNPTISLAWKDVGSTQFLKTTSAEAPERQKDNIVLNMQIGGDIPLLGFRTGIEYRHINDSSEQLGKKLHLGTEISILMFDLRAGFYQGYYTYGLGLDLLFAQLDVALYSIEKGAYPGQSKDERIQIGLNFNIGFDPSFNLIEIGGKKRNVKQRR